MAAGYAQSRPPIHPRILDLAVAQLGCSGPFQCALDVGCGAGVSTRALGLWAKRCFGVDPAEGMLQWARAAAQDERFVAGTAEALPIADGSVDLITAAGSLNYADLDCFFPEAARVLKPQGVLVVYDFQPGNRFREASGLAEWFAEFMTRYPAPAHEAREMNPEILAELACGFRLAGQQNFDIGIRLTPGFYLDYVLTETNVSAAVRRGVPNSEIRSWCAATLAPVWQGEDRDVMFQGYFACLAKPNRSARK